MVQVETDRKTLQFIMKYLLHIDTEPILLLFAKTEHRPGFPELLSTHMCRYGNWISIQALLTFRGSDLKFEFE